MDTIYTSIELGSDTVKIIVMQLLNDKYYVLASSSTKSEGIKKKQIVDTKKAVYSLKRAIKKVSGMLGFTISKCIATVPLENAKMSILSGSVNVINPTCITEEDIKRVYKDALIGQIKENEELITADPICFNVDDTLNVDDPKDMSGDILKTKLVVSTTPKEPLYRLLEVFKLSNIEVVDILYDIVGDYYNIATKELDKKVGAIINIGLDTTEVAIFNKAIMIKAGTINIGSKYVDKDLEYVFKTSRKEARKIKENFAVSMEKDADKLDLYDFKVDGEEKSLNQQEISKVVEARIKEILKLSEKLIKNLTNREIRYIITTGGLSELTGFTNILNDTFKEKVVLSNILIPGIRHNKYSSIMGAIKYYEKKEKLINGRVSMVNKNEKEMLVSSRKKELNNDNMINKIFGHFFES